MRTRPKPSGHVFETGLQKLPLFRMSMLMKKNGKDTTQGDGLDKTEIESPQASKKDSAEVKIQ